MPSVARALMIVVVFLVPAEGLARQSGDGSSTRPGWFDRSFGGGLAPDRLYATGEYGWKGEAVSFSGYGAMTGTLAHASAIAYWEPAEFLQLAAYAGRSQYFHLFRGGGLTRLASEDPALFSRKLLLEENRGGGGGLWAGGAQLKVFWSTFRLLPVTLEGMLSASRRYQWIDSGVAGSAFYDPVAAALVSRNEAFWDVYFFGGWRANPGEKNATRLGVFSQLSWFETNRARQARVGPALLTRAQGSPWELYVQAPVRLVDPYDDRDAGFLVNISYKGL